MNRLDNCFSAADVRFPIGSSVIAERSAEICLKRYTKLDKKNVEVWFSKQRGLFAFISLLNSQGNVIETIENLPLKGMPQGINRHTSLYALKLYFDNSYLVPEKGSDGLFNRVSVRIIGEGGGRSKIPFQPGLAVGSIVRVEGLDAMQKYSEQVAELELFQQNIENAEKEITKLDEKIKNENSKGTKSIQQLITLWEQQKGVIDRSIKKMINNIAQTKFEDIPNFTGFHQAIESPIDFKNSTLETQLRGFDSVSFTSQYVMKETNESNIKDKMTRSSSANAVSTNVEGGWGPFSAKAGASQAWSDSAANRIRDINKGQDVEGVLVINATMTSRHVRCFSEVKYDLDKLRSLVNLMGTSNEEEKKRFGISTLSGKPGILMLTEAVLGGSFTAFVTFLNTSNSQENSENKSKESNTSTSTEVSGGFKGLASVGVGVSTSRGKGEQSEDDVLKSIKNTRVNIEFVAQGAIPTLVRNTVVNEVLKHLNTDPVKYELTQQDQADLDLELSSKPGDKEKAVARRNLKQEKAAQSFLNTTRGLMSEKSEQKIHTIESVMAAYDNFSEKLQNKECGIPVGFNYRVLTIDDIQYEINKLENINQESGQKDNPKEPLQGQDSEPVLTTGKPTANARIPKGLGGSGSPSPTTGSSSSTTT